MKTIGGSSVETALKRFTIVVVEGFVVVVSILLEGFVAVVSILLEEGDRDDE